MLIVCPSCATSYDIGLASLSPKGRKVRCSRCRTVWHAELSQAEKLLAAAAAISPDPPVAEQSSNVAAAEAIVEPVAESIAVAAAEGPRLDQFANASSQEAPTAESAPDTTPNVPAVTEEAVSAEAAGAVAEVPAPPIVPADLDEARPPVEAAAQPASEPKHEAVEDIESAAAQQPLRRTRRRSTNWPLSRLATGIMALILVDAIMIGWRSDFVRALPQTASFYAMLGLPVNLRGLTFEDVVTSSEQHDGVPILVIGGNIVNVARRSEDVPRLKFVVRNAARQEIYSWTAVPSRSVLPPGEAVPFRARLASPPPDAHDLVLRFVTRRDITSGAR